MCYSPAPARTLILGFGNPFYGDDGLGVRVVDMLAGTELPPWVSLAAAGTPGWELPAWLQGWPRAILIDAALMDLPPGAWRCFNPGSIQMIKSGKHFSLHEAGLPDGLALAEALGMLPLEIILYCMQPESLEEGQELSQPVRSALTGLVEEIVVDLWKRDK